MFAGQSATRTMRRSPTPNSCHSCKSAARAFASTRPATDAGTREFEHETQRVSRLERRAKGRKGTISTDSGVLSDAQYSFTTRFEQGKGTNPEELIAAAHAGCFSMALSNELGNVGLTPESIRTTATVTLEKTDAGFAIPAVHLTLEAKVPGADRATFAQLADTAKTGVLSPSCSRPTSLWMPHSCPEACGTRAASPQTWRTL